MQNSRRGAFGYIVMILAFIFLAVIMSDSMKMPVNHSYRNCCKNSEMMKLIGFLYAETIWWERRNKVSIIALRDYPGRYDFETTIGPDFYNTVLTMYANKNNILWIM